MKWLLLVLVCGPVDCHYERAGHYMTQFHCRAAQAANPGAVTRCVHVGNRS